MHATRSTLVPSLRYKDALAAIEWLCTVFGFARHAVYARENGIVDHAQLTYGGGMLMLGSADNGGEAGKDMISMQETGGRETVGLYLVMTADDLLAAWQRAQAVGAEVVRPLWTPEYGGQAFAIRDPERHIWSVGSYDPWAESPQTASPTGEESGL